MSASAGSMAISARPLSSLSTLRQPSSTRTTSPTTVTERGLGSVRARATSASKSARRSGPRGRRRRGRRRSRRGGPRAAPGPWRTASRPSPAGPGATARAGSAVSDGSGTRAGAAAAAPSRCRAAASSVVPKTASPTVAPSSTSDGKHRDPVAGPGERLGLAGSPNGPAAAPGGAAPLVAAVAAPARTAVAAAPSARRGPCRGLLGAVVVDARGTSAAGAARSSTSPRPRGARRPRWSSASSARARPAAAPPRAVRRSGTRAPVLGAGTNDDAQVLGQRPDQRGDELLRSPGTFQEKSSASTRLSVATGTSMVRPSSAAPGENS